jgi:hypothetical protein
MLSNFMNLYEVLNPRSRHLQHDGIFGGIYEREFCVLQGLGIWHDCRMRTHRRLWDTYRFPGFPSNQKIQGIFGDPKARVIHLCRRAGQH